MLQVIEKTKKVIQQNSKGNIMMRIQHKLLKRFSK